MAFYSFSTYNFSTECAFCGERKNVNEIKFEGKIWLLCDECRKYLMLQKDDQFQPIVFIENDWGDGE